MNVFLGESLNHNVKEYFEYHPERIPQMLAYLQDLILLQKKRIMGAFYGDGECRDLKCHYCSKKF